MPTVFRFDGLLVVIYRADHRPDLPRPPALRESYGFSRPQGARIKDERASKIAILCEEWRKIHGR